MIETCKKLQGKTYDDFADNFLLVLMRDTSICYDVKQNAIVLAIESKQTVLKKSNRRGPNNVIAGTNY